MADTTTLANLTVAQLAERMASRDPVPGGGSAAALAGAMAASLVAMVAELTLGRTDADPEELGSIRDAARAHMRALLDLAQADAAAYAGVVAARRLPRDTDAQRGVRSEAVAAATAEAARIPLAAAARVADVAELTARIAPIGNPNAISDAGVAAHLAAAALKGALLNVRINLPYLPGDEALRATAPAEMARLEQITAHHTDAAFVTVADRMEPP